MSSKRPLLILTYYYPPDVASGAARPHRLAKYLERLGHPIKIIAAGSSDKPAVNGNLVRVRGEIEGHPRRDLTGMVEILFRKFVLGAESGATWVPRAFRYASRLIREQPDTMLLSTAPPCTTHIVALLLKQRYKLPWIADFRDPMIGNPFRRTSRNIDAFLEPLIFHRADAVIANTDTVAGIWKEKYPKRCENIHLLWNGFDPEEVLKAPAPPPREQKIITHVGVIYGDRDPAFLLEAVERLIENAKLDPRQFRIQFAGPMAVSMDPDRTRKLKDLGCLELRSERIPAAEAGAMRASADYLLLLDVIGRSEGLQVPAKLFEYIRVGRPILACTIPNSPVERILSHSGVPHICLYRDEPAVEQDRKFITFLSMPSAAPEPNDWFNETFDGANQAAWLSSLLSTL